MQWGFKSSPVPALQVELGEMPLELRRKQLMGNYWANLRGQSETHPTKGVLKECWVYGKCERNHFGRVGNDIAKEFGVGELKLSPTVVYPIMPPWRMVWPEVDWFVLDIKKRLSSEPE